MTFTINSGGQTGADRGGWDAARELGLPYGGWVPKGRRAEDGIIPACYDSPLIREHESSDYPPRTLANVTEASACLLVVPLLSTAGRGSKLTLNHLKARDVSYFVVEVFSGSRNAKLESLRRWLDDLNPRDLLVAGSRESSMSGIQADVRRLLIEALS